MRRTAAITGALLITATMLTACGGGSGVPELDAVAETWEEQDSQFKKEVCSEENFKNAITALRKATLEGQSDSFYVRDVEAAAAWFLFSYAEYPFDAETRVQGLEYLRLDRGVYVNPSYLEFQQVEADKKTEAAGEAKIDFEEDVVAPVAERERGAYLGQLDPVPDPCAD